MIIRTFDDVTRELRQLKDELDRLRSLNLDMNGRRVINAGRAESNNEYTTLGQVLDLIGTTEEETVNEFDTKVLKFNVSTPTVSNDIVDKRPVLWVPANRLAVPIYAGARLVTAPSGGPASFRVNYTPVTVESGVFTEGSSVDLFGGTTLDVADGENYGRLSQLRTGANVGQLFYFTLDCTAINSASGLYLFVVFEIH